MPENDPRDPAAVWDRIAPWWADQIGEGNDFQRRLIMPATDRLLAPVAGLRVLDVACGNGNYARRLGRAGCRVLAVDASPNFLAAARARTTPDDGAIEYRLCDATDGAAVRALGGAIPEGLSEPNGPAPDAAGTSVTHPFDAAVCSMAVMDLPAVDPLFRGVRALLPPGGRFVFSVSHPCFNSNGTRMTAELANEGGQARQVYGVAVTRYAAETTDLAHGILNQPEPHYTYHRPLATLFAAAFAAGFVVDGFEEPAFPPGVGAKSPFSWAKRPDLPPACVVRLRRGE
ncbi:MAG: methyltransferase protein [Phycisphaerales bacterium]|nr:methyltransferase protein [Phycisphaerales bacterium]